MNSIPNNEIPSPPPIPKIEKMVVPSEPPDPPKFNIMIIGFVFILIIIVCYVFGKSLHNFIIEKDKIITDLKNELKTKSETKSEIKPHDTLLNCDCPEIPKCPEIPDCPISPQCPTTICPDCPSVDNIMNSIFPGRSSMNNLNNNNLNDNALDIIDDQEIDSYKKKKKLIDNSLDINKNIDKLTEQIDGLIGNIPNNNNNNIVLDGDDMNPFNN